MNKNYLVRLMLIMLSARGQCLLQDEIIIIKIPHRAFRLLVCDHGKISFINDSEYTLSQS